MLHDPYEPFRISTSQQELLNSVPFVGDTLTSPCNCNNNNHHHDATAAEIIPPIIPLSAPDTHHLDNQDVFHTPREDPPLSSSVIDVSQCEFNQAVIDVDDVSQDSEFGFVEKSRSLEEDLLSEFPEIHPDEFSALDRAISDFDKAPMKLGFDPMNVEQNSDKLRIFENEISSFHDEFGFDSLEENVETQQQVVQNDAEDVNMVDVEGNKSIGSSANERGSGEEDKDKDKEKETLTVFDVLKFLAKTSVKEDDGLTLLETLKRAGIKFPRPSWWPDDMESELFKF